ncbi:MAG: glycosyltransferase [Butyrivibrio sp.]|nr:glycosyltransferase [Butyrivibrio sp.]
MNPVLIYLGDDTCYNVLNYMARSLGDEFEKLGLEVIYHDVSGDDLGSIANYVGREFTAVIGFQTGVFSIWLESKKCFLHDLIKGPKFDFNMDHPIWRKEHFEKAPKDYYVLTHDRNYISFIQRYYPAVKDALLLPPAGNVNEDIDSAKEKGLVFIGTYNNYRGVFEYIRKSPLKRFLNAYLLELRKNYNETPEKVLEELLEKSGRKLSDKEFLDLFDDCKMMITCAAAYYREKVIAALLENNVELTVYGDSWKSSPFADNKNLHIKPEISPEETTRELAKSRLSLNIMTWHKDGFTERIAGSMLAGCVVVSDRTTCLEEQYTDGEEMILFDLKDTKTLAERIKELLSDDVSRQNMAERAFSRAVKEDTWRKRAEQFLIYVYDMKMSGEI